MEEFKMIHENTEEKFGDSVQKEKIDVTIPTMNDSGTQNKKIDKILDIWDTVQLCCYFIPIVTTIVWVLSSNFNLPIFLEDYILFPIMFVGWIAVFLTGPIRLLKLLLEVSFWSGKIGFALIPIFPICLISGLTCLIVCFCLLLYVFIYAPAAITLYCFFRDEF